MNSNSTKELIAFAAGILSTSPDNLTADTACGDIPQWDSVAHIRLIMEFADHYKVDIPLEKMPSLKTISDFAALLP